MSGIRMATTDRKDWETPARLFEQLHAEFDFCLDASATSRSAKVINYLDEDLDGLTFRWWGRVFCNPPYGADLPGWMRKAARSQDDGVTVVMLVPSRTDVDWWHRYVLPRAEVRFIRGRVKFVGAKHTAPFPSAALVFRPDRVGAGVCVAMEQERPGKREQPRMLRPGDSRSSMHFLCIERPQ